VLRISKVYLTKVLNTRWISQPLVFDKVPYRNVGDFFLPQIFLQGPSHDIVWHPYYICHRILLCSVSTQFHLNFTSLLIKFYLAKEYNI
jgi:hypothetical protein